jgi:Na+-transporting NADH:ubiquinone oxidoreductase subunit A
MLIEVQHGLDIAVPGEPEQAVHESAPVAQVALMGRDYAQLRPRIAVEQGQTVQLGQTLFTDRNRPDIHFTSPAAGRVAAIHRGRSRRLVSIVIDVDPGAAAACTYEAEPPTALAQLAPKAVTERLLQSGLWTALRARPYDAVPDPAIAPRAIFVTAMDTRPLAADPAVVIGLYRSEFMQGLTVLSRLSRRIFVCARPAARLLDASMAGVALAEFAGPHPAGLVGTHIEALSVVNEVPDHWHIGYQDVIAVGRLFATGQLMTDRIVALGGPGALRPRLLKTRLGASLDDLLDAEVRAGQRIVTGSVLDGRATDPDTHYLGRYDTQICALPAAARGDAAATGPISGMLSVEAFERVWPFALPPLPLLRALLSGDLDRARALGCLGLAAEDLALCSYVCPAKHDYGAALTSSLEALHEPP